jgi:hypothetical protein
LPVAVVVAAIQALAARVDYSRKQQGKLLKERPLR